MKLRALVTLASCLSLPTLLLGCSAESGDDSGNGGSTSAQGGSTATGGSANGGSGQGGSGQGGSGQGGSGQGGSSGGAASGGTGQGGSGQGGSSNGGASSGGSSNGGSSNGGSGSSNGGSSSSSGGQASGGRNGGNQGGSSNPGTGGGSSGTATFAQVAALLGQKCGKSGCHMGTQHVELVNNSGLYSRLTTPLANSTDCGGTTLVKAGDASNSFLAKVVQARSTCGSKNIARMPDKCSGTGTNACLTAAEIKLITDWIAAGAAQ